MPKIAPKLADAIADLPERKPLWSGPMDQGPQGGISQSLLGKFLSCRERFRLLVVEGLTDADSFSPRMEYGNLWHCCEEAYAKNLGDKSKVPAVSWDKALVACATKLGAMLSQPAGAG